MIRIVDPEAPPGKLQRECWTAAFGLTLTEARVAEALLANDGGLRPAAEQLGMAYGTARVHMAHIFDKVGVQSQVRLARILTQIGG